MIKIEFDWIDNMAVSQYLAPENIRVIIKALRKMGASGDPDSKQADALAGILTAQMNFTGYYTEQEKEDE